MHWLGLRRLITPAVLIEPRRRIAPRAVVGLADVAAKASNDRFEVSAFQRFGETLFGRTLPNLVRVDRPERFEILGGRAPLRGRRGDG